MENETENKDELLKILGLIDKGAYIGNKQKHTWAEIYIEIGRLQEKAEQQPVPIVHNNPPWTNTPHYHNGSPCYNDPCVWC